MADFREPGVLFEEEQYFRQGWLWAILLGVTIVTFLPAIKGYGGLLSTIVLSSTQVLMIGVLILFYFANLKTQVREDGLYYRFFPFHFKDYIFKWEEIESFEVRNYSAIGEYGGWGIRYTLGKRGMAYNVSGDKGVQLYLKNGKRVLFGTQKPDEFEAAIGNFVQNRKLAS